MGFITGCTTNSSGNLQGTPTSSVKKLDELSYHLYARLKQNGDDYEFAEFSEIYTPSFPWVRLADFKPMWNIEKEDCTTGVIEYTNERLTCKTQNKELFREKGVDFTAKKTAAYVLLSVLSSGLWAAMPPAAVKFNRDRYLSAIEKANKNLHKTYQLNDSTFNKLLHDYDYTMNMFDVAYNTKHASYRLKTAKPVLYLHDESKLFSGAGDVFGELISTSLNKVLNFSSITKQREERLDRLIHVVNDRNKKSLNELMNGSKTLLVQCQKKPIKTISYTLKCPNEVPSDSGFFDVEATVHSINYKKVLPRSFTASNKSLTLSMESGVLNIENKTNSFVNIDSLSFYHNGKISSKYKMGYELPPSSVLDIGSINFLPVNWESISFYSVTKNAAIKQKVEYGFAMKYRVINTNKEETLLKRNTYKLFDLISNI